MRRPSSSFLVTSLRLSDDALVALNLRMQALGPDLTRIRRIRNVTWLHNLLWTGEFDGLEASGEVMGAVDGPATVVKAYATHGSESLLQRDDDWSAALVDWRPPGRVVVGARSRPMWFAARDGEWAAASCASAIPVSLRPAWSVDGVVVASLDGRRLTTYESRWTESDNDNISAAAAFYCVSEMSSCTESALLASSSAFLLDAPEREAHDVHARDVRSRGSLACGVNATRDSCDDWTRLVVEGLDTAAARAVETGAGCRPFRAFANFFKGQAAPALRGLARCPGAYTPIRRALALARDEHPSQAWRDLATYALAAVAHAGAGGWDLRVFPNKPPTLAGDEDQSWLGSLFSTTRDDSEDWAGEQPPPPHSQVVRVVATASAWRPELERLRVSCRAANLSLDVLGLDHLELAVQGYAHDWKLRLLAKYLADVEDADGVLVVDAYDVLLAPSARERFIAARRDFVLFSSEVDCWPDAAVCRDFPHFGSLNSGAFFGSAAALRRMLATIEAKYGEMALCGNDDQRVYQRFAVEHPGAVELDRELFQSMHGYNWTVHFDDGGNPRLEGSLLRDFEVIVRPAVLHFNSHDGKAMYEAYSAAIGLPIFVVSLGRRATERREHIFRALAGVGLPRVVDAVDGDDLVRRTTSTDNLVATWQSKSDRRTVARAFDWTDPLLGGAAMPERLTKRILACAVSHLRAAAAALRADRWPALVVEDDVDATRLSADVFTSHVPKDDPNWTVVQLSYLIDDPWLAGDLVARRCARGETLVLRDCCAPANRLVGAQAYLLSRRGAMLLVDTFVRNNNNFFDLTARSTLNFAADYLVYNLDGVYVATRPVVVEDESIEPRSTIGQGHVALAQSTRALTRNVLDAPCDAGVIAAASLVLQHEEDARRDTNRRDRGQLVVLIGDFLVRTPRGIQKDLASLLPTILRALEVTDLKVRRLLAQALAQCDASCAPFPWQKAVVFPSPMSCFVVVVDDDPMVCARLGLLRGGPECARVRDALAQNGSTFVPCGEDLWCAPLHRRAAQSAANAPRVPTIIDDDDAGEDNNPRLRAASFLSALAAHSTAPRAALFVAIANAWKKKKGYELE